MTTVRAGVSLGLAMLGAWTAFPSIVSAQTCLGAPSLAGRFTTLEGTAGFYEGGSGLGIGLTFGSSLFLEIDYVREYHDEHARPQDTFLLGGGWELSTEDGSFGICPTGSYGLSKGIYEFRTRYADAGMAAGFRTTVGESLRLVPFGRVAATWSRTRFGCFWCTQPEPDWAGLLVLGTRIETSPTVSFGPTLRIPFANDRGDARFGAGLGISVLVGL